MLKIPINSPLVGNEECEAVSRIFKNSSLTSSSFNGGKSVQNFEKITAKFTKSKFVIAVNSGTAALQASLLSLDIKEGDEVLVPSFSFIATANAVASTGAKPVFVDILKENYTVNPDDVEKKITKKTKAIIPVHLFGNVAFVDRISEIANRHNLYVIEDSAQSLGSFYKQKHSGTFFDLGCFSMYPGKVMTSGEGGFILTQNKKLHDKLLMIRNHGLSMDNKFKTFGLNFRLSEIHAAVGWAQMKKLPKFLKIRKANAKTFSELLCNRNVKIPQPRKHEQVNWYLYTISTDKQKILLNNLQKKGIQAQSYYTIPIHKTQIYRNKSELAITDWASSHVVSLPVHPQVTKNNIELMASIISESL